MNKQNIPLTVGNCSPADFASNREAQHQNSKVQHWVARLMGALQVAKHHPNIGRS